MLIKGRVLTGQDRKDQPRVLVVDEAFAQKYWPNEEAVGKRIRFGGPDSSNPLVTVVGVVRRVKMEGLDNDSGRVQAYLPYLQFGFSAMSIVVRASVDPLNLAAPVRQQVLAVDSDQPIYNLRTMEAIRIETLAPQRLNMLLLSIFAAVALVLAAVGIYGVMAYSVTQRTHELGIRMALGAERADVLKLVLGQAARLSGAGLAIGLAGAFLLTRWMSSLLFGVSATDPLTFFCISALLAGVAMAATIIPARRAMRVDPMIALRYE
jgi:putative ABC transport system permease protein